MIATFLFVQWSVQISDLFISLMRMILTLRSWRTFHKVTVVNPSAGEILRWKMKDSSGKLIGDQRSKLKVIPRVCALFTLLKNL